MGECWFVFLFVAALTLALSWRHRWSGAAQGLLLGLAVLTRPAGLLLPLMLWPLLPLGLTRLAPRPPWGQVGTALLICGVMMGGWTSFNFQHSGRFSISTISALNTAMYEWPAAEVAEELGWRHYLGRELLKPKPVELLRAVQEDAFIHQVEPGAAQHDLWPDIESPTRMEMWSAAARARLRGHWATTIGLHLAGALQLLRPYPPTKRGGWLYSAVDAARLLLCLLALVVAVRQRETWFGCALGLWAAYVLLLPGYVGIWRLRAPLEPALCLLLGCAWAWTRPKVPIRIEAAA